MTHTVDRVASGYCPTFDCVLLPIPQLRHTQWDHGDVMSRALLAWQYVAQITGDQSAGKDIRQGLWRHLRSVVHPQSGMAFVPEHSDVASGHYYYHMWDQGRLFDYLVLRMTAPSTNPSELDSLLGMVRRLQMGVLSLAVQHRLQNGEVALYWPLDVFWGGKPGLPPSRDFGDQNWYGWCISSSQLLGPQSLLAKATGDESDLDLAIQIARGFLAGLEHRRGSTCPMFGPQGGFRGHWHGAISGLSALVTLARHLWTLGDRSLSQEWIALAKRVYGWLRNGDLNTNPVSSCGMCPETASDEPWSASEICCTADLIELSVNLAACANLRPEWRELADAWDVVERATRNELLKTQITTPEALIPQVLADRNVDISETRTRLSKLSGAWASGRTFLGDLGQYIGPVALRDRFATLSSEAMLRPDTPMLHSGGCCAYSGIRGLFAAWKHSVVQQDDTTEIRIPTEYQDANVTVHSRGAGTLSFSTHRDCSLRLRCPAHVKPDEILLDGAQVRGSWGTDSRWLSLPLVAGDTGTLAWPTIEWQTREVIGPINEQGAMPGVDANERVESTLTYQGNLLVDVQPSPLRLPYMEGL